MHAHLSAQLQAVTHSNMHTQGPPLSSINPARCIRAAPSGLGYAELGAGQMCPIHVKLAPLVACADEENKVLGWKEAPLAAQVRLCVCLFLCISCVSVCVHGSSVAERLGRIEVARCMLKSA